MKNAISTRAIQSRSARPILACALSLVTIAPGVANAQQAPAPATAASQVIYPAKGQSPRQQDQDKFECHEWARERSGFDPTQPAPPPTAGGTTPTSPSGAAQSGAQTGSMARGGMRGAAVAELSHHDSGRGAAMGVLGAGVMGRVKEQQSKRQAQQQEAAQLAAKQQTQLDAQQRSARTQQRGTYDRAIDACMEARGYVVR